MNKRFLTSYSLFSIIALLGFCLFSGWGMAEKTVRAGASFTEKAELEQLRLDLSKIDGLNAEGLFGEASVIVGKEIKARDIYLRYIKRAAGISDELLTIRTKMELQGDTINLQQLGAICQKISLTNSRFKDSFQYGEEDFQTYQLIQKAIGNLEAAISYWRIANQYRKVYRGGLQERMEDDEVLKVKLLTAMNAIEELKAVMETRAALSRDLEEYD